MIGEGNNNRYDTAFLAKHQALIQDFLQTYLQKESKVPSLQELMAYSSLNGGKRLRGILCLAAFQAVKPNESYNHLIPLAAGIECIHTMSLIHDDLPCMDDAQIRRGQPTCHLKYGEAKALLAGDALLVTGLDLCLSTNLPASSRIELTQAILQSIGLNGMTGGQVLDLQNTNTSSKPELVELDLMHNLKTGAFLVASVLAGSIAAEANQEQKEALRKYAQKIGLAFQIADDLLDIESSSEDLGKTAGKDSAQNKWTYPTLLGLEFSRKRAKVLVEEAKLVLRNAQIAFDPLEQIADYIVNRGK